VVVFDNEKRLEDVKKSRYVGFEDLSSVSAGGICIEQRAFVRARWF
jgi:hypothetical protein